MKREEEVAEVEETEVEETEADTEVDEQEEPEEEESESEKPSETEEEAEEEADEVIVTVGDESPPQEDEEEQKAPKWVKELRKKSREDARRIRELERQIQEREQQAEPDAPKPPGAKPKLEDHDYDAEEFDKALSAWYEQKRKVDEHAAKLEAEKESQQQAWQKRLEAYGTKKSELKVRDYEDAEHAVLDGLNQTQQGIILQGADNPALVVYAIGKNHDRVKELASIDDPVKFAFAVAKLEKDLKVSNRKAPPPPERTVSGTGKKSGSVDSTLEKLRAEAEKTGNYTKVVQYRNQQKRKKQ